MEHFEYLSNLQQKAQAIKLKEVKESSYSIEEEYRLE